MARHLARWAKYYWMMLNDAALHVNAEQEAFILAWVLHNRGWL